MQASVHVWQYYGLTSQVWLYRLLRALHRFPPALLLRQAWMEGRRLDEFPWPADRLLYFPERSALARLAGKIPPWLRSGRWDILNAWDARFMREACERLEARVINLHLGWLGPALLGAGDDLGAPVVLSFYGIDVFCARSRPGYVEGLQALFRRGLPCTVTSQCLKDGMVELGADPAQVTVVPVGIWPEDFPSEDETVTFRTRRAGESARPRLITVGRLVEYKAPHRLPDIARILRDRGIDVEWSVVGEGPLLDEVRRRVDANGVGDRFFVRGRLPFREVNDLRWNSDLMVHNAVIAADGSRECLGVTLLEAQAAGIPVVSCRVGGIPEAVADGQTGLLAPEGDLEGMADRIALLCKDASLRLAMGLAGVRRARSEFNSIELGAKLERLYDSLPLPVHARSR